MVSKYLSHQAEITFLSSLSNFFIESPINHSVKQNKNMEIDR